MRYILGAFCAVALVSLIVWAQQPRNVKFEKVNEVPISSLDIKIKEDQSDVLPSSIQHKQQIEQASQQQPKTYSSRRLEPMVEAFYPIEGESFVDASEQFFESTTGQVVGLAEFQNDETDKAQEDVKHLDAAQVIHRNKNFDLVKGKTDIDRINVRTKEGQKEIKDVLAQLIYIQDEVVREDLIQAIEQKMLE